jgi:hypothetical protein
MKLHVRRMSLKVQSNITSYQGALIRNVVPCLIGGGAGDVRRQAGQVIMNSQLADWYSNLSGQTHSKWPLWRCMR